MALLETDDELRRLLLTVGSVAVVGVSPDPSRPSHGVAAYLLERTAWNVDLVNPNVDSLFGQVVYPSLADLPAVPDLVDVFRRYQYLPEIAGDAIEVGAGALWLQLGLSHSDAARSAADAGLDVVQDHCLKVEHGRLLGAT